MLRVHCVVPEIRSGTGRRTDPLHLHRVSVITAKGKHPAPFRTRKLSLSAPMVLHGQPCGRLGRCRTTHLRGGHSMTTPEVFHSTCVAGLIRASASSAALRAFRASCRRTSANCRAADAY